MDILGPLLFTIAGTGVLMYGLFMIHPGLLLCFMGLLTTGLGRLLLGDS